MQDRSDFQLPQLGVLHVYRVCWNTMQSEGPELTPSCRADTKLQHRNDVLELCFLVVKSELDRLLVVVS